MEIIPFSKLSNIHGVHDLLNKTTNAIKVLKLGEIITINISNLKYITPIGFTSLLSIIGYLDKDYELKIKVPLDEKPITYMERMNFLEICGENIKTQFEQQVDMDRIYNRTRYNLEGTLLEVKKAYDYDDIEEINESIKKILKNKGIKGNRLSDIQTFITELGNNVIDHTNSPCFISIKNNEQENEIEIAVSDTGDGIYKNLKKVLKGLSPDEVVSDAIMTKASSLYKDERGKGLMDVRQRAFRWSEEAQLYLRTHDSVYQISKGSVDALNKGEQAFGTFFQIKIRYPVDK